MGLDEIISSAGRLGLLVAGLLLPGALVLRALRLPPMLAGSIIASATLLYTCVVLFTLLRVPISLATLSAALGVVCLAAIIRARRITSTVTATTTEPEDNHPFSFLSELGPWTALLIVFWAVILWRLATQPLTGGDIDFRWSWLAEQMLRHGSLDFYPPLTALDFTKYFWVESIPPGVAALHGWAYACAGGPLEIWTSAGVLLHLLALHDLVWRLAFQWGGRPAARRAVLLAAAVPVLNWSVLMGQETGLTAVALCGLCYGLSRWQQTRHPRWLALAAFAAVLGAATREYGLAFPVLGLVLLALMRAPRPALLRFAVLALPVSLAWPLRTWIVAGNPFYSLSVGGFFAINPLFVDWAAGLSSGSRTIFSTWDGWRELARYFALFAPAATLCWLAVGLHATRRQPAALLCAVAILLSLAIWFASVPYTGGGLFYSLRVLSPAFALGAAFGGYAIVAAQFTPRFRRSLDLALLALFVATLPATLTLPQNPFRLRLRDWPAAGRFFVEGSRRADAEVLQRLQTLPHAGRILSECLSLPRSLAPAGITVVPMWSPAVAWLFDPQLHPAEVARRWRESGLRYVVMTRSPAQLELLARRARWMEPFFTSRPVWQSSGFVLFEITAPATAALP